MDIVLTWVSLTSRDYVLFWSIWYILLAQQALFVTGTEVETITHKARVSKTWLGTKLGSLYIGNNPRSMLYNTSIGNMGEISCKRKIIHILNYKCNSSTNTWTLSIMEKNFSRQHFSIVFFFSQRIGFDISCTLSPKKTIKEKLEKIFQYVVCKKYYPECSALKKYMYQYFG